MPHNYPNGRFHATAAPLLTASCLTADAEQKRLDIAGLNLQAEILERTRAEKNLQQQFTRFSLLNQITRAISERQELEDVFHVVLQQLHRNLANDLGIVLLCQSDEDTLTVAATRFQPHPSASSLKLRERDVLKTATSGLADCLRGQTLYAKETASFPGPLFASLAQSGFACAVVVPLVAAEKTFGLLLLSRRLADAFSSGECEFFRIIGDHVALAAHQARLYDQLQSAFEELKQTQQAVMQQERLRALGEMASGIAHDINNTLSPIVVYSELLLGSETSLSETARRHLRSIQTAGEDIAHLVSRLRDFYRKRENSDDFAMLSGNDLVEQVVDLTRPRWRDIPLEKGIVIRMCPSLQPGLPAIFANAAEIREALTNLILNAVDAMPSGGSLTITTGVEETSHPRVFIEVSDTGIGMDEVTRARCLEPFFSTKGQRGTGLGLSMVFGIMERHRGKIEVDSHPGKGTSMRLIFPTADRPRAAVENIVVSRPAKPLRILYIDDEPLLRDLLKETLELDGHSVTPADHGQAGIDAFRIAARAQQAFDIVITDLGMPQLDGRQVAQILKNESPAIPIILLTGWGNMIKADGDHCQHVDAIISKPPHLNELRENLHRLCRQTSAPDRGD